MSNTLVQKVGNYMDDNAWHTLAEVADAVQGSEASVSARIRDLRKPAHGGRIVERESRDGKQWYRLVPKGRQDG